MPSDSLSSHDKFNTTDICLAHHRVLMAWVAWLIYKLIGYPLMIAFVANKGFWYGVLWQVLVLLPALVMTPIVVKGQFVYGLMAVSLVSLLYLATAGVYLAMYWYADAQWAIVLGSLAEVLLLSWIVWYGFVLLKRLPSHRNH